MNELGEIISTTVLSHGPVTTEGAGCPRTALGLACLLPDFPCTCTLVEGWEFTIETGDGTEPKAVHLRLTLTRGRDTAEAVMDSIDLTGLNVDYQASHSEVTASLSMRRPENIGVKTFMAGSDD